MSAIVQETMDNKSKPCVVTHGTNVDAKEIEPIRIVKQPIRNAHLKNCPY